MIDKNIKIISTKKGCITTGQMGMILKKIGIHEGDDICVHSQLFGIGKPLLGKNEFLRIITEILLEAVGKEGTLIMPTFSYSFCRNEDYDVLNSKSTVGILSEYYRKFSHTRRTHHPIFSFAVQGKRENEYLDVGPDAFGFDSVYGKLIRNKGKIVFLGENIGYTACYLAEEHVGVSYRYFKEFSGNVVMEDGSSRKISIPYYVRHLDRKSNFSEHKMTEFLTNNGILQQRQMGNGVLSAFEIEKMFSAVSEKLMEDETYFL